MSTVAITPELSLQLQRTVNEVGLSQGELKLLLQPEVLSTIVPLLAKRAKIVPHNPFPVWDEIEIEPTIVHGQDLVSALEERGIRDNFFSFDHLRSALHVGVRETVRYELFVVTLRDLGLYQNTPYQHVLKRAVSFGLYDQTATPVLIAELLLQGKLAAKREQFKYRIPTSLASSSLFGTVSFGVGNGFTPEDPSDTSLSLEEPLFLAYPSHETEDVAYETFIFSRLKRPVFQ
jgi:hypothetical protein